MKEIVEYYKSKKQQHCGYFQTQNEIFALYGSFFHRSKNVVQPPISERLLVKNDQKIIFSLSKSHSPVCIQGCIMAVSRVTGSAATISRWCCSADKNPSCTM